jgi:hypothetical protein
MSLEKEPVLRVKRSSFIERQPMNLFAHPAPLEFIGFAPAHEIKRTPTLFDGAPD